MKLPATGTGQGQIAEFLRAVVQSHRCANRSRAALAQARRQRLADAADFAKWQRSGFEVVEQPFEVGRVSEEIRWPCLAKPAHLRLCVGVHVECKTRSRL